MPINVVSEKQWLSARQELLVREKELARLRDDIAQSRRDLPWHAVKEDYLFSGPDGDK